MSVKIPQIFAEGPGDRCDTEHGACTCNSSISTLWKQNSLIVDVLDFAVKVFPFFPKFILKEACKSKEECLSSKKLIEASLESGRLRKSITKTMWVGKMAEGKIYSMWSLGHFRISQKHPSPTAWGNPWVVEGEMRVQTTHGVVTQWFEDLNKVTRHSWYHNENI